MLNAGKPMSKQRGFNLLEVMLALTIFALIASSLLYAVSAQVQSTERLIERSLSRTVVSNAVQELQLLPAPSLGVHEDDVSNFGQNWRITVFVEEVQPAIYNEYLRRVTVQVRRPGADIVLDELMLLVAVDR